jgi:hypothetical protein
MKQISGLLVCHNMGELLKVFHAASGSCWRCFALTVCSKMRLLNAC